MNQKSKKEVKKLTLKELGRTKDGEVVFHICEQTHIAQDFGVTAGGRDFNASNEIGLSSYNSPEHNKESMAGTFFVRGNFPVGDDNLVITSEETFKAIQQAVKEYNEFYAPEWKPKVGEVYRFIRWAVGAIHTRSKHLDYDIDEQLLKQGNYFKTQEAAEAALAKIQPQLESVYETLKSCERG